MDLCCFSVSLGLYLVKANDIVAVKLSMLHLEVVFVISGEFPIPMGVNSTAPSQWTSKFRFGGSDVPIVGAVFGKSCHIDLAISPRPGSLPKILDCVNDAPPVLGLVGI